MVCDSAGARGDVISRGRLSLAVGVAMLLALLGGYGLYSASRPNGVPIRTAGSEPGWFFLRSDPPGHRLTLVYQFPNSRMQFVGACHTGPGFFYFQEDVSAPVPKALIDGVEVPMQPSGEHGGIFFDDADDVIARITQAKRSIVLNAGAAQRALKPSPDIARFVDECRQMVASRR